jgi:hypothetical protein
MAQLSSREWTDYLSEYRGQSHVRHDGRRIQGQMMGYERRSRDNLVRSQPGPQAVLRVKVVKAATCLAADGPSQAAANVRPIPTAGVGGDGAY